jgi:hypothetical protein
MNQGQMSGNFAPDQFASGAARLGAADVRQAEIPHQMQILENTLKGCAQGLDTLSAKLEGSVMRSTPPQTSGANSPTPVPSTPYGSRLQELASFAAILNERIQSLSARLEV